MIDFDLGDDDELRVIDRTDRREARLGQLTERGNRAFAFGEKLVYSVRYGFIHAGEAVLEVRRNPAINGRPCYRIIGTAKSNEFFSSFFRVDDRVESYLDTLYLLPWRFEKELHEGKYHNLQRVEMDQINRLATYLDGQVVEMTPEAQDIISAIYYLRTHDLYPGQVMNIKTHADHKNIDLEVRVGERSRVDTPAGKFDCIEVEPLIVLDTGLYDHKKGKLLMYLTDDERRLPVMFKVKVFFGSIVLALTEMVVGERS